MSDDIHDLLREIDKALEQVRAVGAIDADLSLKLPRAAQPAFEALCVVRDPLHRPDSRYQGIPITEWTDGPFMSFSLDHKVIFDHTMPDTFYGKGVHDMVVELRNQQAAQPVVFGDPAKSGGIVEGANGERFRITGSSAWVGTDGVKREAPEFTRIGTKTVEHNFSTAHDKTIDMVRALWRKQMAYQWGGKYWRITSIVERNPGEADVRSIEVHRPATFFDLQAWLVGEITSIPIELDCPALPIALIPEGMWADAARPSTISKLLTRRRKLIAKAKRASPDDAAVGSAILAMSGKGRANEL